MSSTPRKAKQATSLLTLSLSSTLQSTMKNSMEEVLPYKPSKTETPVNAILQKSSSSTNDWSTATYSWLSDLSATERSKAKD